MRNTVCPLCYNRFFIIHDKIVEHDKEKNLVTVKYKLECSECQTNLNVDESYNVSLDDVEVFLEDQLKCNFKE